MTVSGDHGFVRDDWGTAELARELASQGEIYLALDVLLGSLKAPHDKSSGKCSNAAEWFALVEVFNMAAVRRAAEDAFQITSFLSRFGLQPFDEVLERVPYKNFSSHGPPKEDTTATDPCCPGFILPPDSLSRSPSELSAESSADSDVCVSRASPCGQRLHSRRDRIRTKWQQWKTRAQAAIRWFFRDRDKQLNSSPNSPSEHVRASSSDDIMTTRSQIVEQSSRGRYFTPRRFRLPRNDESISRSRSYAFWALSECEVQGNSETSDASATSFAMMEDLENLTLSNSIAPRQTKGIERFFGSFKFRSVQAA